jgi:predicted outer membrane repeat protein
MKSFQKIGLFVSVMALACVPGVLSAFPAAQKAPLEPLLLPTPNFVVTTTEDLHDVAVGDGICDGDPSPTVTTCSLRAATEESYMSSGADVIGFACGAKSCTYQLTRPPVEDEQLATGDLNLMGDVTILGLGKNRTIIDANGIDRAFITGSGKVTFRNLKIRNGKAKYGAGIFCVGDGEVRIYDSAILDNEATEFGGGIRAYSCNVSVERSTVGGNKASEGGGLSASKGNVTVIDSEFVENQATASGGAIATTNLNISKSLVASNQAAKDGGGIWFFNPDGQPGVVNVTFADNTAGEKGGAVYNRGQPAAFDFVTFYKNAAAQGGAIFNHVSATPGHATIRNSLFVSGASGGNCAGTGVQSEGYNIDDGTSCAFAGAEDLSDTDAKLDPNGLDDHGGKTRTVALLTGSPAIDTGDASGAPATDQRGVARPQPSPGDVDRGAFEATPEGLLVHQAQLTFSPTTVGTSAPSQNVTFQNIGNAAVGMTSLSLSGAFHFSLSENCSGQSVLPGQSCTATVTFTPLTAGNFTADLMFTSTVGSGTISLLGDGTEAAVEAPAIPAPETPAPDGTPDPAAPSAGTGKGKIGTVDPVESGGCSLIR